MAPKYSSERRKEIIRLLDRDPYVSVLDLVARFGVSKVSIRRDLNELRKLGMLERTYGGALKPPASSREVPFSEREVWQREEKERIGQAAASLITPGEVVLLDDGTTTPYIIPHLAKIPRLSVVTWGLNILSALIDCDGVDVIVVGGTLNRPGVRLGGFLASTALDAYQIRFGKMFLAISAISAKAGVMSSRFEAIAVKRKAIDLSHEVIVVADSSKIGIVAAGLIVPCARIHRLITGHEATGPEVEKLRDVGVIVDLV